MESFFLPSIQRLIRKQDWFRAIKPYFPSIKVGNKTVITGLCDLLFLIARQIPPHGSGIELSKVVSGRRIGGGGKNDDK